MYESGDTRSTRSMQLVAWDPSLKGIVLSFKGTDNDEAFIENWVTNLDFFKESPIQQYPQSELHTGFWNAWQSLKPGVVKALTAIKNSHLDTHDIHVYVTGHSLGAAIASNAAMDLKLNEGYDTSVVNFGSPRVGDINYHNALLAEVPHWRVTHNNDPVVHAAPVAEGFYHASTEIHFPERNGLNFKVCDGSGEDSSCADACARYLTCTSIADHLNYLEQSITCASDFTVVV